MRPLRLKTNARRWKRSICFNASFVSNHYIIISSHTIHFVSFLGPGQAPNAVNAGHGETAPTCAPDAASHCPPQQAQTNGQNVGYDANAGSPLDHNIQHALTPGKQVVFPPISPHLILTEAFHSIRNQDGEHVGDDILKIHRARNHAPRAPTFNDPQDSAGSGNQYQSETDNSDKETDPEDDAPKYRAPRNSKGYLIIRPTTLWYYSRFRGWPTILIAAKRQFALYVSTANAFPIRAVDLESADKILASAIISFGGKGGVIDDGWGFIIAVLFSCSFYFLVSL